MGCGIKYLMRALELAQNYMEIIFGGGDLDRLNDLLSDDLSFEGPFYRFDTAAEYVDSLKTEPPQGFNYEMIQAFENGKSACLIYQFSKPGISIPMVQMFEVRDDRISRILLVFDTEPFKE